MKCKHGKCKANAMKDYDFCFVHNPDMKIKHKLATSKGGSATLLDKANLMLPKISLKNTESIMKLLEDTINRIRTVRADGTMEIKTANCIGFLASHLQKAIEMTDIVKRLEKIEQITSESNKLNNN